MLFRSLIDLIEEILIGAVEVLLERLTARERVARVEIELIQDVVELVRSRQTLLQALDLGAEMLRDHRGELLVAEILVRVPLEQQALDDLLALRLRQRPRLLQAVAHLFKHLLRRLVLAVARLRQVRACQSSMNAQYTYTSWYSS